MTHRFFFAALFSEANHKKKKKCIACINGAITSTWNRVGFCSFSKCVTIFFLPSLKSTHQTLMIEFWWSVGRLDGKLFRYYNRFLMTLFSNCRHSVSNTHHFGYVLLFSSLIFLLLFFLFTSLLFSIFINNIICNILKKVFYISTSNYIKKHCDFFFSLIC